MHNSRYFLFVAAVILGVSSAEDNGWDGSQDPKDWSKTFPQCGEKEQSPIRIRPAAAEIWTPTVQKEKKFDMKFDGYEKDHSVKGYNTGYLANITFENSSSKRPRITLKENGKTVEYFLANVNFHWPSEHIFGGRSSAFETHMMHRNQETNHIIALAYLIDDCRDSREEELNMYQEALMADRIEKTGSSYSDYEIPTYLMPRKFQCGYYMYEGSLTTPPCTEVTWFIYRKTLCINEIVIDAFKRMQNRMGKPIESNNRPEQEIDQKLIYLSCNEDPDEDEYED